MPITRLNIINIAPLVVLFCNCPLADLKLPARWFVIALCQKILVSIQSIFTRITNIRNYNKCKIFWDKSPSWFLNNLKLSSFNRAISKFSKMYSGNLSQIALPNMWSLLLIKTDFIPSNLVSGFTQLVVC